jgi:hypothetical protein
VVESWRGGNRFFNWCETGIHGDREEDMRGGTDNIHPAGLAAKRHRRRKLKAR